MILEHSFDVAVPFDEAWATLTNLKMVAPCLPGANLDRVDGDSHFGTIVVKLGAITTKFAGQACFVEHDAGAGHAVLQAEGRDQRGAGKASATITAAVATNDGVTSVKLLTDLKITGKVAQLGRSVIPDLSSQLIDQFAVNLEARLVRGAEAAPQNEGGSVAPARISTSDLINAAGPSFKIVVGAVLVAAIALFCLRRSQQAASAPEP